MKKYDGKYIVEDFDFMDFQSIVGQEGTIKYLIQSIQANRVGHAYIFDGQEGSGKKTIAHVFAKAVLCQQFQSDVCGKCPACLKVDSKNHPDLKFIEREKLHIVDEQIEAMQQDLSLRPYESHRKIYIIDDADTMTDRAQNRLLKTLEEPPQYGLIILLSTNVYRFLSTIRSRCQIIKLNRLPFAQIEEYLKQFHQVSPGEARILAAFSDGFLGKAMRLKESQEFQSERENVIKLIEKLLRKEPLQSFPLIEFFKTNRKNIEEILDLMLIWFRDMLLLNETGSEKLLINLDQKSRLEKHMESIQKERIPYIIEQIEEAKRNIKANVNFELAIEVMLLRIQEG